MSLTTRAGAAMRRFGFQVGRVPPPEPLEPGFEAALERVRPFTMVLRDGLYANWTAARHVARARVPGDVVEAGVWRGGSAMMIALALVEAGDTSRTLYLYDTYEGMTRAGEHDRAAGDQDAVRKWEASQRDGHNEWCYAPLEDVRRNVASTGYPTDRIELVKGPVEQTIPGVAPERIAILRLDTDWYESTRHELEHLYPRLSRGGVLLIDDYGKWEGARRAVDEYLDAHDREIMLTRVDRVARVGVKTRR